MEFTLDFTLESAPSEIVLTENDSLVVEAARSIRLDPAPGSRTLRFEIDANFDAADSSTAVEDMLLAYLFDPADPSRTLLDRGENGTAFFALSGDRAEFPRGRVRFDGSVVEVDLTGVEGSASGNLVF